MVIVESHIQVQGWQVGGLLLAEWYHWEHKQEFPVSQQQAKQSCTLIVFAINTLLPLHKSSSTSETEELCPEDSTLSQINCICQQALVMCCRWERLSKSVLAMYHQHGVKAGWGELSQPGCLAVQPPVFYTLHLCKFSYFYLLIFVPIRSKIRIFLQQNIPWTK